MGIHYPVPLIAITSSGCEVSRVAIVNSEVEQFKTITTVNGLCKIWVYSRLGINLSMPLITVTSSSCKVSGIAVVNSQVEQFKTIATVNGLCEVRVYT